LPYTINYLSDNQTILSLNIHYGWTSDDLWDSLDAVQKWTSTTTQRIDLIIEVDKVKQVPRDILARIRRFLGNMPDNTGLIVLISESSFVPSLVQTLYKLYPFESKNLILATNPQHACDLIAESRASVI